MSVFTMVSKQLPISSINIIIFEILIYTVLSDPLSDFECLPRFIPMTVIWGYGRGVE